MKYVLKEMNKDSLPREKLMKYGAKNLSDYELLAVILKTGAKDKSVIDLSIEMIEYFKSLNCIDDVTINELTNFYGIGLAKGLEILSCIELGKRLSYTNKNLYLKTPESIYKYIRPEIINLKKEELICLYVDNKYKLIAKRIIGLGNLNSVSVDVKDAIKWALKYSSCGIIYVHNHPSNEVKPSNEDKMMTELFISKTLSMDLDFVDHLIVGNDSYYSFNTGKVYKILGD